MNKQVSFFWFRRDLRLHDNAGLYHALKSGTKVIPVFIFDKNILDRLEDPSDRRVNFIHQTIASLSEELKKRGSGLVVKYGEPLQIWNELTAQYEPSAVFTNHDYEPYAIERDTKVTELLKAKGVGFHTYKDQCIFEKNEVLSDQGKPYTVFTPYSRKWKSKLNDFYIKPYPSQTYLSNLYLNLESSNVSLKEMGFQTVDLDFPIKEVNDELLDKYAEQRNFPALRGTSRLGVHLRFGTISIRELANKALETNETFLNELIWRDFYMQILWYFPHVKDGAFKPAYDRIKWRNNEAEFAAWCEGKTGYPIVDAGMRELNATGFMHNRVRMIVASFLTKHLLIDWRWGEAYFAKKLLDFDLSANNGGWQWAAGSGTDSAPYFRVFNPSLQTEKFDPKGIYIKKWVPEYLEFGYPAPIVQHEFARKRCLEAYKMALGA
jgi:deoxyribodipyrimidine photo-lyase